MPDTEDKLAPLLAALPNLSVPELKKLGEAAESARLAAEEASRTAFAEKVRALASEAGVPLPDLLAALTPPKAQAPARSKATGASRAQAPVKYEGPNGETWSGRGRPAAWLVSLEGQGRKREEFLKKA